MSNTYHKTATLVVIEYGDFFDCRDFQSNGFMFVYLPYTVAV